MFTTLSLVILLLNVVLMVIDSMKSVRYSDCCAWYFGLITDSNFTVPEACGYMLSNMLCSYDFVVTFWFTFEFCIRFWSVPSRCAFVKDYKNWGDLVSFLPYYIEVTMSAATSTTTEVSGVFEVPKFLRLIKIVRVIRLIKVVRHSKQLQVMAMGLKESKQSFMLMAMLLSFFTFGFSATLYYIEGHEKDTFFISIPEAAYWSIATYFAYGDSPPVTAAGKLICSVGAATGVIILAFPIGLILDTFTKAFNEWEEQEALRKGKKPKEDRAEHAAAAISLA